MKAFVVLLVSAMTYSTALAQTGSTVVRTDAGMPEYRILKERIVDTQIKAEVAWDIMVTGSVTEDGVQRLLNAIHKALSNRTGFKFYNRPSSIWIYAFTDQERATNGEAQWIAMLGRSGLDGMPEIDINTSEFAGRKAGNETKLGMSEQERRSLYQEFIRDVGARAANESLELIPIPPDKLLKVGEQFKLTRKTPLCPEFVEDDVKPGSASASEGVELMKPIVWLPVGTTIKVLAIRTKYLFPWYQVTAFGPAGKVLDDGWINGLTMMLQTQDFTKASSDAGREYSFKLEEKYRGEFLKKHGLSKDQLRSITSEALIEDWTFPR